MISSAEVAEAFYNLRTDMDDRAWSTIRKLKNQGVPVNAIVSPDPVLSARIAIDDDHFDVVVGPYEDGSRAFLFLARDPFGPVDIIGWLPKSGRIVPWLNRAALVGEENLYLPRLAPDGALRVFRDPLGWLRAGRQGVVILDYVRAARRLEDIGPLLAENAEHAAQLRKALARPAPRIIVGATDRPKPAARRNVRVQQPVPTTTEVRPC